jgi:asparagine synthase (glutamine-hydrolysing)
MCGIVGFTGKRDKDALNRMMDSIYHRGPDDDASLEAKNFSVGFRRLAIIDLSKSIYPLTNEEKTVKVFLNGEIYNYQELQDELKNAGHKFKTQSDTEVIAHGYEQWGEKVVEHLRGMFVFVIYDEKKDSLFIARDRLGIKPLYYAEYDGRVIFSSEIKALFAGFAINRDADDLAVYRFLVSRVHDIDKNTFFSNVKRLLPGHQMTIDSHGNFRIEKYWKPTFNPEFKSKKSDQDYAEEFKEIFTEAVRLHLIGDVPVGVTLSGGLDSTGITALASKLYKEMDAKNTLYTFSAIHPGETVDESKYIDYVTSQYDVKSIKIKPEVDKFWEDLPLWTYFQEEPVISGAPYAYYTVMREARKYVTVLLSGQGGDELLAGYIPYFFTYLQSALNSGNYLEILRESFLGRDLYTKFAMNILRAKFKKEKQHSARHVLSYQFAKEFGGKNIEFKNKKNLNERLFEDVTSSSTPSLLRYEDKNGMANALESRVPFFDHKLVEYIFNLPIDQKIKNGWTRFIYREAMKGIIPEGIRRRRSKIGFTNPESEWIERKSDKFIEIFSSDSFRSRKYWNADAVLSEFKQFLNGEQSGDILYFWRIFSIEMWLRTYVDQFKVIDTSKIGIART